MPLKTSKPQYIAHGMDGQEKKELALNAVSYKQTITSLAEQKKVSRQFIHIQKNILLQSANETFSDNPANDCNVLYHIPVTKEWIEQCVIVMVLDCRSTFRGVIKAIKNLLDYNISLGKISSIVKSAIIKAIIINAMQNLKNVKRGAHDELFHQNKPVLAGVDIDSLYCYLLSYEDHRDGDTWGVHLLDLQEQGFSPESIFGDDASGLALGHNTVFPDIPYHLDNFHLLRDLTEVRRFVRNKLKTATSYCLKMMAKMEKAKVAGNTHKHAKQLGKAKKNEKIMRKLSQTIDTLVDWMSHDVLNKPGLPPKDRRELYDFIVDELAKLAEIHPHRISSMVTTLRNQASKQLGFVDVLDEKFINISEKYSYPLEKIWELCQLQRYDHNGDAYPIHSLPFQDYFKNDFEVVEDAVIEALDSTEKTSSMVENLNSRISKYFSLRQEIGYDFLELLRFYLNHSKFLRSEKEERRGKTPAEILNGEEHSPWLEMLEYQPFKQAA
jgi:hypothetical protein